MPKILRSLGNFLLKPIILVILLILISIGGVYLYVRYTKVNDELMSLKDGSIEASKKETEELVKKVGILTELPQNEVPTIATVTDVDSVRGQQFFSHAQNGDKVLIYSEAKRAFLYRPSNNKLIEVAPINIDSTKAPTSSTLDSASLSPAVEEIKKTSVNLAIYNGTAAGSLSVQVLSDLKSLEGSYTFNTVLDAVAVADYGETLVIPISSTFENAAKDIATTLNAKVGVIPENETVPDASVLVIIGADYIK